MAPVLGWPLSALNAAWSLEDSGEDEPAPVEEPEVGTNDVVALECEVEPGTKECSGAGPELRAELEPEPEPEPTEVGCGASVTFWVRVVVVWYKVVVR